MQIPLIVFIESELLVQLLPAGPDFLRPVEELTVRLCYVNFDGKPIMYE